MIPKEEREKDKAVLAARTDPCRPWRLGRGVPPFGTPDEVFVTACGACLWNEKGALDREEDGVAIITAVNRIEAYIADAEEMERRIAKIKAWHKATTDPKHGDPDERAEEVLAGVLSILRGGR